MYVVTHAKLRTMSNVAQLTTQSIPTVSTFNGGGGGDSAWWGIIFRTCIGLVCVSPTMLAFSFLLTLLTQEMVSLVSCLSTVCLLCDLLAIPPHAQVPCLFETLRCPSPRRKKSLKETCRLLSKVMQTPRLVFTWSSCVWAALTSPNTHTHKVIRQPTLAMKTTLRVRALNWSIKVSVIEPAICPASSF